MPPSLTGGFSILNSVSIQPSDLPGPVGAPSGPTEGAAVVNTGESPGSAILAPVAEGPASIVGAPEVAAQPVVAAQGEVILAIEAPWYIKNFDASIVGCPIVASTGTPVPAQFADQVVSTGAANGVTIVKR